MCKRLIMLLIVMGAAFLYLPAQNAATINVRELSDQQIKQIVEEVNARGLTIDQAAQMAQMQGATPDQIEEVKKRIQDLNLQDEKTIDNTDDKAVDLTAESVINKAKPSKSKLSVKAETVPDTKVKEIFGSQLFNTDKLTFEPALNIPTPQNYVLGIDDELMISIWGASQKTYQLQIETDGAIHIPDLGLVYVAGMDFSKAKELIKKRLIAIYQGIGGPSPNTYADVALSNLRSIKANVIGEVRTPGTYILPSTASVFNALYLSGGPNENGSFRNIQIIRGDKVIKTIDVYDYLLNANTQDNIQLREQDVIYIPIYQKRVMVSGAFKRKGIFELKEEEKLTDLIRYVGGFNEKAYQSQLSLTRVTETEKKVIDINRSIYDSFTPHNGDSIVASEVIDRYENRVTITGAIFRPGHYELTDGLTLSGLIKKAQGVKEDYFGNRGLILRLNDNLTPMTVSFNVDDVLKGINDIKLQREDQVVIQNIFNMREKRTIQIFGEVQKPGEYVFSENMTLKDIIFLAGGLSEAASELFIELARRHSYEESNKIDDQLVKLFQFKIDRDLNIDTSGQQFILEPFDCIYLRKAPSYNAQRTVYISGEVKYPGSYSIGSKTERVSNLIYRAGGLTPNAFVKGASMKRKNEQIIKNIEKLQNTVNDSLLSKVEKQATNDQLELRLENILKNPGTPFDYILKDGDEIYVPEVSQEIRISGEIRNPIGLAFESGRPLKYYVERSGGFSENASKSKVFVIYSDGTTKVTRNVIFPVYPEIEPGCQIIIPTKPERVKVDNTGKWLGIASTLATILLAVSSISKF